MALKNAALVYGHVTDRTDTKQGANMCLGIHLQTCVPTFVTTHVCPDVYLQKELVFSVLIVSDVEVACIMCLMMVGANFLLMD